VKRVAFLLKVKKEKMKEYRQYHANVWPDMLAALRRNEFHNHSLFMTDDGLLFGYFETPASSEAALAGLAKEEINTQWQKLMGSFFENLGERLPTEGWIELEEVFHQD